MTAKMAKSISQLSLGQKVTAILGKPDNQEEKTGTIRFLGTTSFSEGEWVGLELEDDGGKNDGEVRGQRYFTCPPQRGLFMRPTMVKLPGPEPTEDGQDEDVSLRLQLAKAVEGNDVGAIQELLSQAEVDGVPQEEIDSAKKRLADLQAEQMEEHQDGEVSPPLQLAEAVEDKQVGAIAELPSQTEAEGVPQEDDLAQRHPATEGARDEEVILRLQLVEAVEDNDLAAIAELLPKAEAQGVRQEEIDLAKRRLAYWQELNADIVVKDSADKDPENPKLIDRLGGEAEVKKHQGASRLLQQKVAQMVKEGEDPASQPAIYQGMGLEHMLQSSVRFKNDFDDVCNKFAKLIQDKGFDVSFMAASIKSVASAASKVNTEYHGDCRQLKDVVRGTLVIKSGKDGASPSIASGYEILQMLVEDKCRFLEAANARFTRFSDRYQKPVGAAKYRDWLFLVKIGDFVCELQVNFEAAVQVKEQEQHHHYELQRLATRKLLESAMRNDYGMVHLLLASTNGLHGESLVNARDCHGFTPLHYAARHGNVFMLDLLMKKGADVLALDREGLPPLHHALCMMEPDACGKLLTAMDELPKERLRKEPLASNLQATWGAAFQSNSDSMKKLAEKLAEIAKRAFSTPALHLQGIARSGDVPAMRAAYKTLPLEYVKLGWEGTTYDAVEGGKTTILDRAILSGSAAMAAMVAQPEEHGAPQGIAFQGLLAMHNEPKHVERLVRQGRVARFRALHEVRPPDTRRMAELLVLAAESEQLEMAHQIWTRGGEDLASALTDEEKLKLVALGKQAAALGHEDFVRLLIEAKAPVDTVIDGRNMIVQAAQTGQTALVGLLAEAGADVQNYVLSYAVDMGHHDTAELLLKRRADPKQSWNDGKRADSVIGTAIMKNRPEMLQLLAEYGADTYTDENLEYAEQKQAFECLEFMRRSRDLACPA